MSPSFTW